MVAKSGVNDEEARRLGSTRYSSDRSYFPFLNLLLTLSFDPDFLILPPFIPRCLDQFLYKLLVNCPPSLVCSPSLTCASGIPLPPSLALPPSLGLRVLPPSPLARFSFSLSVSTYLSWSAGVLQKCTGGITRQKAYSWFNRFVCFVIIDNSIIWQLS